LGLNGDPAEALRRRYGVRPKPAFVQEAWPTLLEVWLPADADMRQFIVEELRGLGLGKTEIAVRSKQGQLDYLRSCRNATTLREIVVAALIAIGEPQQFEAPPVRDVDVQPPPGASARETDPAPARRPATPGETGPQSLEPLSLDDWIEATLKEAYHLEQVERDPDGDIPIPRGSSVLFIRPHEKDSPFLQIFAPLLRDFRFSPAVYEAVNAINVQIPMAKVAVVRDDLIMLSSHLLTNTLSPTELLLAIDLLSSIADQFDTMLQKRFGGETMLSDDDDAIDV
jgi:hypothetical protein